MNKDELLTRNEVMDYLKISHGTLHKLMKQKAIPYIKLEKKVLFRKSDIDKFLNSKTIK
jgi:excisionase family DNA binding protein